jgi:LysR family transcriptional regulator, regulator for metE and metH
MTFGYTQSQASVSDAPFSRLEIRDLRMVLAVAAEGSLTRAGKRLNLTQPALSRHLRTLEERLGTALFSRTGSRMQPTAGGDLVIRHAREVLDRVAALELDLHALHETPRRVLRVGTECYTGYHWLPHVINRYTARHADVDVEIAFEAGRKPLKMLRAGTIDVALLSDAAPKTGFTVTKLFTDEYVAVVAPGHPLATRTFIEGRDLAGLRVLLMSPPESSMVVQHFLKPSGAKPRAVNDVQLVGAIAALAEAEFGVGMVPSWTIAPEVRSGRLVPLRLGRNGLKRLWTAAVTPSLGRERWVQDFVQSIATAVPAMSLQPAAAP